MSLDDQIGDAGHVLAQLVHLRRLGIGNGLPVAGDFIGAVQRRGTRCDIGN
jgi:hypothetical protein